MTNIYLSMPYKKKDNNGQVKKDIDDSQQHNIAREYILTPAQLSHLSKANSPKVIVTDYIRKRRAEGSLVNLVNTNLATKFGQRYNLNLKDLTEVPYIPEVFKYHRTGVKIIDSSGNDIKK